MQRVFWAIGSLVLAGALTEAASAADAQPIYRMVWNVLPQHPLPEAMSITPGNEVLRLKLTPPALYRTPSDIRDQTGAVIVPAGTQLIGLKSDAVIACTIHDTPQKGKDSILFLGSLKRVCLIDADRDGRFETRFLRATNYAAYFLLRGRLSDRQQPIEPISLQQLDPAAIEDGPRLLLKLSSSSKAEKQIDLTLDVGADWRPFPLSYRMRAKSVTAPAIFDLYGGKLELSTEAGEIRIRTLSQFSATALDFWDSL